MPTVCNQLISVCGINLFKRAPPWIHYSLTGTELAFELYAAAIPDVSTGVLSVDTRAIQSVRKKPHIEIEVTRPSQCRIVWRRRIERHDSDGINGIVCRQRSIDINADASINTLNDVIRNTSAADDARELKLRAYAVTELAHRLVSAGSDVEHSAIDLCHSVVLRISEQKRKSTSIAGDVKAHERCYHGR